MHIPTKKQLKRINKFKRMSPDKFNVSTLLEDPSSMEAFLFSLLLFRFPKNERNDILSELEEKSSDYEEKLSFQYLIYAFDKADQFYFSSKELLHKCSFENLISFTEFSLNRLAQYNLDINGKVYPEDIAHSKYEFVKYLLPTILYISKQENLPQSTGKLLKENNDTVMLLLSISQYHSINNHIKEVLKGTYVPKDISYLDERYGIGSSKKFSHACKYFMQRAPQNIDEIEIYNDLNYSLTYKEERDVEQSISIMKDSGLLKNFERNNFMHFDMSKSNEYDEALVIKKTSDLVENIYGSLDCLVSCEDVEFNIRSLINLIKKIVKFSNQASKSRLKQCKHINVYKQNWKNLCRHLELEEGEKKLASLLVLDVESGNLNDATSLPFIKFGNTYYIFFPLVVDLCYEKVLDKLLSRKNVEIKLPDNHENKGLMFESKIIDMFSNAGFEVGKINRDHKKSIPEIDALVNFDKDTLLLIEAKCSIKPEQRQEVFSYVENHLSKAVDQLVDRVEFLTSNPQAAYDRLGFSVFGKKIVPLVVSNHSFFTGHRFITETGLAVYSIDEILLNKIISKDYIPTFIYTGNGSNYVFEDQKLVGKEEKLKAIINPVAYLKSKVHRTIQPLIYGSAFEVYKAPMIDWSEMLERKSIL
ncbi:hypothetical protein ACS85_10525 [Vibrio parahaemolyticus]|uniref:hypothetical protein n=1 Tax=Vibrio parahaemolyticus TaxID=670 RepID=UPI0006A6F194|nr:hypothetical protein [Vibrio parahaemolyticus]EGR2730657.1 hypothetical protein [Vibrio parahaemolyticus]EGR3008923.1 hypothetical protein [Vibrio parahaemolyticus]EHV9723932.1 hypothetical protein [Vibrio parahaemolyticus]EIZ1367988.1 hypothetical protein [Vibrio parahaemolyticus]EJC6740520.1 hypothetical protein [Vibrio parahaemolyticus]